MSKPSSIEDLLKPASGSSSSPPSDASTKKLTSKAKTQAVELTSVQKLSSKMADIQIQEKEQSAKEEAARLQLSYIALRGFPISPEALSLLSREQAQVLKTIAFLKENNEIRLGTVKPTPEVEELRKKLAEEKWAQVEVYLVSEDSFDYGYAFYDRLPEEREVIYGYRIEEEDLKKYEQEIADFTQLQAKIGTVSTTDIVTLVIGASLKSNASDIHIEAEEEAVRVRFRMDGVLYDAANLPRASWKAVIARLKLLAGVKINIEDVPQDGRITIYLSNEKIDIRVSFLPTAFGESVVLRLLRPKTIALEFDKLGIRDQVLHQLSTEIEKPNGMIITTGPTGSGKTTTLYAILKKLNNPEVKIITLEDPIEYKLSGINQSQIDHSKSYDFAKGLRSILRQDPDIVMVGEIRDVETAEIAIQAALTGHLVISTLHTNSAAGAIPRLLSMGVKPFLLAPALNALIGQRLVRRLCERCKEPARLTPSQLEQCRRLLGAIPSNSGVTVDLTKLNFMGPGKGCEECHQLKYKGRVGIYEVLTLTKQVEEAVLGKEVSEHAIQSIAIQNGMLTMAQDGLLKALDGITSVEEILAATNVDATIGD